MRLLEGLLKACVNFVKFLVVLAIIAYGFSFYSKFLQSKLKSKILVLLFTELGQIGLFWLGWLTYSEIIEVHKLLLLCFIPCVLFSSFIKHKIISQETAEEDIDFEIGFYLTGIAALHFVVGIIIYSFLATKGYDKIYWGQAWDDQFLYIIAFPVFPATLGIVYNITAKDLLK